MREITDQNNSKYGHISRSYFRYSNNFQAKNIKNKNRKPRVGKIRKLMFPAVSQSDALFDFEHFVLVERLNTEVKFMK